ncbi:MAG: hypothetical protein U0746_08125 [Gemmataceae bacterium]
MSIPLLPRPFRRTMTRPVARPPRRLTLTPLEDRCVPAVIAWDGGPTGNGTDWLTPANWAGDVLPGPNDDVTFGSTGTNPPIQLRGSTSVRGVTNNRTSGVIHIVGNSSGGNATLTVGAGGLTNNALIDLESEGNTSFGAGLAVVGGTLVNNDLGGRINTVGSTFGLGPPLMSISVTGGGQFINMGLLDCSSLLTVSAAPGSSITNAGGFRLSSGDFTISGSLTNLDPAANTLTGGSFSLLSGTLRIPGAIDTVATNFGLSGGGRVVNTVNGTDALANLHAVAPSGKFDVTTANFAAAGAFSNAGTVSVGNFGNFTAGSFSNAGTVYLTYPNATLAAAGGFVNEAGGTLYGIGTVAAAVSGPGTFSPGAPPTLIAHPGNITVSGGISLGGPLVIELAGTTAGTQYDRLTVTGPVALGGPLTLSTSFTAPANAAFVIVDNDGTDAVTGTFAGLPQGATVTANGQTFTIDYAGGDGNDVVLTRTAAPTLPPKVAVGGVVVNNGQAQRSRVTSLTLTFDQPVTFAQPTNVAAAFRLTRIGGGAVGSFAASASTAGGVTTVTLSNFAGAETVRGSLVDGRYTLTVLASQVSAVSGPLDGNGDGIGGDDYVLDGSAANGLFRYYGDFDGDGDVDGTDLNLYVPTLFNSGNYNAMFDFDGDGDVDGTDLFEFIQNLFVPLP